MKNEYAYYSDEYWSSVKDHETGRCLTKLCLYCASVGVSVRQQEQCRKLTAEHRLIVEEFRGQFESVR